MRIARIRAKCSILQFGLQADLGCSAASAHKRTQATAHTALTGHWPKGQHAAVRPVIAAIHARRSIISSESSVSGQSELSLRMLHGLLSVRLPQSVVFAGDRNVWVWVLLALWRRSGRTLSTHSWSTIDISWCRPSLSVQVLVIAVLVIYALVTFP